MPALKNITPEAAKRTGSHGKTHGLSKHPLYLTWFQMLERCYNEKHVHFDNYGGRGISVCDRWQDVKNFIADMGLKPEGTTLDRIDNNGNYEPSNCRWARAKEQARNRRDNFLVTAFGKTKTLVEWSELTGLQAQLIKQRVRKGVPCELALSIPAQHGQKLADRIAALETKTEHIEAILKQGQLGI